MEEGRGKIEENTERQSLAEIAETQRINFSIAVEKDGNAKAIHRFVGRT